MDTAETTGVKLLTVSELMATLKISRAKAYSLINTPGFPVLRIGRCIRVPQDLLDEWIKKNTSGN